MSMSTIRIISTSFVFFALFLTSCANWNHGNFNRQKYLKGNLKQIYGEEVVDEFEEEVIPDYKVASLSTKSEKIEEEFELKELDEVESSHAPVKSRVSDQIIESFPKRIELKHTLKPKPKKRGGAAIGWFFVLLVLGLLSLILFIWIGWWSMLVCGAFFMAALIVILSFDPPTPRRMNPLSGMLIGVILGALFAAVIVLGIIALIIWGIVAIILAIIN
jgi:hypothetical protein